MKKNLRHTALRLTLLGAVLLALPACSRQPSRKDLAFGRLSGKVTYDGEPVSYGYVVLYPVLTDVDPKAGSVNPVAFGDIRDGAYEILTAPVGMMKFCIATSPDLSAFELKGSASVGFGDPSKTTGDPKKMDKKGFDKKGLDKKGGGFKKKDGPDVDGKKDLSKKDLSMKPPGKKEPNPLVMKMTAQEKRTLREIHAAYGVLNKTPLVFPVREGEQTHDLILQSPDKK